MSATWFGNLPRLFFKTRGEATIGPSGKEWKSKSLAHSNRIDTADIADMYQPLGTFVLGIKKIAMS
jgi:hypothetical protein